MRVAHRIARGPPVPRRGCAVGLRPGHQCRTGLLVDPPAWAAADAHRPVTVRGRGHARWLRTEDKAIDSFRDPRPVSTAGASRDTEDPFGPPARRPRVNPVRMGVNDEKTRQAHPPGHAIGARFSTAPVSARAAVSLNARPCTVKVARRRCVLGKETIVKYHELDARRRQARSGEHHGRWL